MRDIQDLSLNLKLSLDGEKNEGSLDTEDNVLDEKKREENAVLTLSKGVLGGTQKAGSTEKEDKYTSPNKFPAFKRRKNIFVIAVDCDTTSNYFEIVENIIEAAGKEKDAGSIGFILSTALSILEIYPILTKGGFSPSDFDGFICNSGGELYYSSSNSEDSPSGLPFVVDLDYRAHTEYRWGGEGLRKTLDRWASSVNDKKGEGKIVSEDESGSTAHCFAFKVKDAALVIIPCILFGENLTEKFISLPLLLFCA